MHFARVTVTREGNFTRNGVDEVDEAEIFEGAENRLTTIDDEPDFMHFVFKKIVMLTRLMRKSRVAEVARSHEEPLPERFFGGKNQCFLGNKCTITWYVLHIILN